MAEKISWEDLKEMVKGLSDAQQRLAERVAEQMAESQKQMAERVAESQKRTDAMHRQTEAAQQKTEEAFQDLKVHMKELSRSVRHINDRWGQFMENPAERDLLNLLRERGIRVDKILSGLLALEDDGHTRKAEYDLVQEGY